MASIGFAGAADGRNRRKLGPTDEQSKRRRISRACDQCNQLRTKCDGKQPCQHCIEFSLRCEYIRVRKKRGKASKRDRTLAAQLEGTERDETDADADAEAADGPPEPPIDMAPAARPIAAPAPPPPGITVAVADVPKDHDHAPARSTFTNPMELHELSSGLSTSPATVHSVHRPAPRARPPRPQSPENASPQDGLGNRRPRSNSVDTGSTSGLSSNGSTTELRYPILNDIKGLLHNVIPTSLACELLESYFETNNLYRLASILRRCSLLHRTKPRKTSPALLLSVLLSAAYSCESPLMTSKPSSRQEIISKLTDLTVSALKPLVHTTAGEGTLDDVMTYVHLGTVTSASEFKGTSLRWWHAGWTLAQELKLNAEAPELPEEEREERRRTWWLLYIVDRHLGLCYNRPLAFLDSQSMEIYRPMGSDDLWNSSEPLVSAHDAPPGDTSARRIKGVSYEITGPGLFGFFLPLMSLLGGIVEVHHLEHNPTLQLSGALNEMRKHLGSCIGIFAAKSSWSGYDNVWIDYAEELVSVLKILLAGYWDPLDLLYSPSMVLSSRPFIASTADALVAAKALDRILCWDPELVLMPFFFAIYLFLGSTILLKIVDTLKTEAGQEVGEACETIVRAHEVCIVTLNTEYQRNFRRVMRGALHTSEPHQGDMDEGRRRRRQLLSLYRWSRGGTGLAV
ncbi:fungal-specific transcription factor domain-containing protein [Dipodascopsis tothii]|uniref:fungal-specific transcription factor domain-containing protein n=1 Tax=Dipodascopsis tothii TaxID=44089 RepID=UPI0034CFA2A1